MNKYMSSILDNLYFLQEYNFFDTSRSAKNLAIIIRFIVILIAIIILYKLYKKYIKGRKLTNSISNLFWKFPTGQFLDDAKLHGIDNDNAEFLLKYIRDFDKDKKKQIYYSELFHDKNVMISLMHFIFNRAASYSVYQKNIEQAQMFEIYLKLNGQNIIKHKKEEIVFQAGESVTIWIGESKKNIKAKVSSVNNTSLKIENPQDDSGREVELDKNETLILLRNNDKRDIRYVKAIISNKKFQQYAGNYSYVLKINRRNSVVKEEQETIKRYKRKVVSDIKTSFVPIQSQADLDNVDRLRKHDAIMHDISISGCCILVDNIPSKDRHIYLEFSLPDSPDKVIKILAKVIMVNSLGRKLTDAAILHLTFIRDKMSTEDFILVNSYIYDFNYD